MAWPIHGEKCPKGGWEEINTVIRSFGEFVPSPQEGFKASGVAALKQPIDCVVILEASALSGLRA